MSKSINQYNSAVDGQNGDYFLLQRGTAYKKITKQDLYSSIQATIGASVTTLVALEDVDTTYLSDGDILQYNSATQMWECVTPTGGSTDLAVANKTSTTFDITSSTGLDATLPQATITEAGLFSAADKVKLGDLETAVNLRHTGVLTSNYIPKANGTLSLTDSLLYDTGSAISIGATTANYYLSLNGNSARDFGMNRHTTSNTAGNNFSIYAGGATSGASDKNGGDLRLYSGISTGNGSSNFYVYTSSAGTSGTADRTQSLKFSITGTGVAKFENSLNANCFMQTGYNMVTLLGGATGYGIRISRPSDGSTSIWGGMMPTLSDNKLVFGGFNAGFYFVRNPQSDTVPSVVISGSSDNSGANIWAGVGTSGSYTYHYRRTFTDSGSSTMSYYDHIGTCSSSSGPTTMTINNSITNTFSNNIGLHLKTSGSTGKNIAIYVESGQIGVGTNTPNASCLIDFVSTTMGVGVVNMTTAQKNAIASPKLGLIVFDTDLDRLCSYESTGWQSLR